MVNENELRDLFVRIANDGYATEQDKPLIDNLAEYAVSMLIQLGAIQQRDM